MIIRTVFLVLSFGVLKAVILRYILQELNPRIVNVYHSDYILCTTWCVYAISTGLADLNGRTLFDFFQGT